MTAATIFLVLLLPLASDGLFFDAHSESQHWLWPPTSFNLNPLTRNSERFRTSGSESHLVKFTPEFGDFPAYLQVQVSNTEMPGRDPISKQCLSGSIKFYDGNTTKSPLLVDVCGSETPTFDTTHYEVLLVTKNSGNGASINITAVYGKIPPLKAQRDRLATFVFPSLGYQPRVDITHPLVTPPPPPPIRRTLTFQAVNENDIVVVYVNRTDISGHDITGNCFRDKAIFYDGSDTSTPVLATVCGSDTPTIRSTGRALSVHFEGTFLPGQIYNGMTISYQADEGTPDIVG